MSQEYKSEAHGMNNHEVDEGVNKWPSIIVTFLVFKFLVHHQIFQFGTSSNLSILYFALYIL